MPSDTRDPAPVEVEDEIVPIVLRLSVRRSVVESLRRLHEHGGHATDSALGTDFDYRRSNAMSHAQETGLVRRNNGGGWSFTLLGRAWSLDNPVEV